MLWGCTKCTKCRWFDYHDHITQISSIGYLSALLLSNQKSKNVLTIVTGGSLRVSGYLSELPLGSWIVANIYYLGLAGVSQYHGLCIAGISDIYNSCSYHLYPYITSKDLSCLFQYSGQTLLTIIIKEDW